MPHRPLGRARARGADPRAAGRTPAGPDEDPAGRVLSGFSASSLGDALAWLDSHQNLERMLSSARPPRPDLSRMRRLADVLGHPERASPMIHVTGTNGKTSTARFVSALLSAKGLRVGTFTSPHLERINERIAADGEPISDGDLAGVLTELASIEPMLGDDIRLSWFEILTGAALAWFADRPVDVGVFEVGLGGRWDATNVIDAPVAVVLNIGLDHVEFLGPRRSDIAGEKAGVVKRGATLVLGERDPDLRPIFEKEEPAALWWVDHEYGCSRNDVAVGGRLLDLYTLGGRYDDVFLDLHGGHQGENFAAAVAATEAFFGAALDESVVRHVAGSVRAPGSMEVVGREPLVILAGAKNVEGARASAIALAEEFGDESSEIVVVGMLRGKDPEELLRALGANRAQLVVACPPASPRAEPTARIAAAASALGVPCVETGSVPEALEVALRRAEPDDVILVTGSLYVVGEARATLVHASRSG